jgi:Xaa-Pro aminopeptidase
MTGGRGRKWHSCNIIFPAAIDGVDPLHANSSLRTVQLWLYTVRVPVADAFETAMGRMRFGKVILPSPSGLNSRISMTSARRIASVSRQELERRWALVREYLGERQIDACIAVGTDNHLGGYIRWFTDSPTAYRRVVIFYPYELMTVIEHGSHGQTRRYDGDRAGYPGVGDVVTVSEIPSIHYTQAYEAREAIEALTRRGCRAVGLIGAPSMPYGFIATLKEALAGRVSFVDMTDFIDSCKAVKSPEEIALIRRGAQMQDTVFDQLLRQIRPGMTDFQVAAIAQHEGRLRGSEQGIFLAGSAPPGEPAMMMSEHLQGRTLAAGDVVTVLIENASPGGYFLELARSIVLGKAPADLLEAFEQARQAQAYAASLCRPGAFCSEIFLAYDAYMKERGLSRETRLFAHGQGYDLVERPLIRQDETLRLAPNMCLTIHPGVVSNSVFAVNCDNYLVEADGMGPCLHQTVKQVFEI